MKYVGVKVMQSHVNNISTPTVGVQHNYITTVLTHGIKSHRYKIQPSAWKSLKQAAIPLYDHCGAQGKYGYTTYLVRGTVKPLLGYW